MDEQSKGMSEQWGGPERVPERGYTGGVPESGYGTAVPESGYARDETPGRSTAEVRVDIEQTREEMQETIDEIEDRLRPRTVMSRTAEATVGRVRDAAGRAQEAIGRRGRDWTRGDGSGLMDRLRDNPIPLALAAGSLAWLAFSRRRKRSSPAIYGSSAYGEPHLTETTISHDAGADEHERAGGAHEGAGRAVEHARSMAGDAGGRVRRASRRNQARRMTDENTLAAGVIAAAMGLAIGLALPGTRRGNELMGEARDSAIDRAKEAARAAARRVQAAAGQAGTVAGQAAESTRPER